jgi:uncharacterized protein
MRYFRFLSYFSSMKTIDEIKNILNRHKQELIIKYGLKYIAIFGSYGRGDANPDSDVDILVDFNKPIGIEFIDLANELEKLLDCKVDLVSKNGVKQKYLHHIEKNLIYV